MRRLGGGWLRLACIYALALMMAARSQAADGVWPPAVRYEAFLRAVELVSSGANPEATPEQAALDAAYRTYLERAGELRVGCGRARDQLDRSMGLDATPEDVDRAWAALQQATARAAIAERELADRVVELVPGCRMSASALSLRFRVADAFSVGGSALTPFAALLQFRPPLDDRALVIAELERLLPAADRTLRAGMEFAVERAKAYQRYCAEHPPPNADSIAEQAERSAAWAAGWSERRVVSAKAKYEVDERFAELVDRSLERLLAQTTPATAAALEDAWNHASGAADFGEQFRVPWRGVHGDEAAIAAARERVADFLRRDRDEAKAYRNAVRDESLVWLRVYAGLEQASAKTIREAEERAAADGARLEALRSDIGSRRLNASRELLEDLKRTIGGGPASAVATAEGADLVLLTGEIEKGGVRRGSLASTWRVEREAELPHRWLPPSMSSEQASIIAARLGRADAAAPVAAAIAALEQVQRDAEARLPEIPLSTMGLAPETAANLRSRVDEASRLLQPARTTCIEAMRACARGERERFVIDTAIVERFGGDPGASTMSRSLQPWGDRSSQLARRGNPAWAVERATLDQETLEQARAIIARFATELVTAMDAYDRVEADCIIEASSWPRNEEEVGHPHDGESALRRAAALQQASERLDAAAAERDALCERVRSALRAELPPDAAERVLRTERRIIAPDLPRATEAFLDRLDQDRRGVLSARPEASESADALAENARRDALALDDQLAAIAWRPEGPYLWWPNVAFGEGGGDTDAMPSQRERRKWLLFARDESRIQWLTSMERLLGEGAP